MRTIQVEQITEAVANMCKEACYYLPQDVYDALVKGKETKYLQINPSPVVVGKLDEVEK